MKLILITSLFLSLNAFAASKKQLSQQTKNALTISSVEVTDLTEQYEYVMNSDAFEASRSADAILNAHPYGRALNVADVVVDKVINIGQKVWNVVEKGRPIQNYSRLTGSALPQRTQNWTQLQNWSQPKSKVYSAVYKNVYGIEVVKLVYRVIMVYGGDVGGVGRYIGYTTVEPVSVSTAYMFTFNARVSIQSVFNMGTSHNPVAGMLMNISWTVETVLQKKSESRTYSLDGLGKLAAL